MAKVRIHENWPIRELLGESLGTFIMIFLGVAGGCIVSVNSVHTSHQELLRAIIWVMAVACAYHVTGNLSGGHYNPCVTIGLSAVGKFHPSVVLAYILAQFFGALAGAAACIFMYRDAIYARFNHEMTEYNVQLAASFSGQPDPQVYWATFIAFSFTSSMFLLIIINAISDPKNMEVPRAFLGFFIGIFGYGFLYITFSIIWTGDCFMNPVRDVAPRIMNFSQGYNRATSAWFTLMNVLASIFGGVTGSCIYCFLIEYQYPVFHRDTEPSK